MNDKKLSVMSIGSEDFSVQRQSMLLRELEMLLDLNPRELSSSLLALPRELRDRIFDFALPDIANSHRPELHTCLWGADMVHEPWRHDIFGYGHGVPKKHRLHPNLQMINRQLRNEILQSYFRRSKLTLHAELRNSRINNGHFEYSPHILQLPMLKFVTHVRFYVEWNYTVLSKNDRIEDQIRIAKDLMKTMDTLLTSLEAVENIELSVLFFWKLRSGKHYMLSMQDLFDLEDVFKRHAESRWLRILRTNNSTVMSPNPSAGVGYKLSSEDRGTDQSGGMEIFVSQDLEEAMQSKRKSMIDFYGNYGISDPLPQPAYEDGKMI
ncbi:uncharacterized protein N0V89_009950 [Didymosphaeria variabile]|uniref:F-box domain-containing protein n=1 Tax=Didymosphaeria variabile TaxID=1932322 RepID=A0A9W8XET7_9PLEO|nr:uncharacterized protein N0V89_009950 [Didymosphaeria variabile]KAJ4348572.1 hypothetical protein N0V89_009950 [Didymosphaeria variabile]